MELKFKIYLNLAIDYVNQVFFVLLNLNRNLICSNYTENNVKSFHIFFKKNFKH